MYSKLIYYIIYPMLLVTLSSATGCSDHQLTWEKIIQEGELRFATVEGPATYYETPSGPAGFEYELAKRFAEKIGVNLRLVIASNSYDVISMVTDKKAAIGGAALMSTSAPENIKFGPGYYSVPQQLIYHRGETRPADLSDIETGSQDINALLRMVQHKEIKSTVANSYQVNLFKHLYPDIRVAFNVTEPQSIAWIYRSNDDQLDMAISDFFEDLNKSGELDLLIDRYFGHMIVFDYIDTSTFLERVSKRLPQYEELFKKIGKKYNIDWTLLAAMSYQESHWQETAKSPTGVRGLMMLTLDTAEHLGISDRTDPEQSVDGGARYFTLLMEEIPARIDLPDRIWMALAAYNVGLQHLEHARIITQQNGNDPDRWRDVRKTLLQLGAEPVENANKPEVRWNEPVRYVRNIRKYRDILRWLNFEKGKLAKETKQPHVLSINSPVL